MARVVVVGAGIGGLAAAQRLLAERPGLDVVVLDAAGRVGGKLALGEVGGLTVDLGAESLLARRPEAVDLARAVGLGDDLVTPRSAGALVRSGGRLHPLPTGTVMGVPSRTEGLDGLLPRRAVDAVAAEPRTPHERLTDDTDVATFVRGRVGDDVVARLVEPLLGGVYAGHAERLSLRATVPALWEAAVSGGSVVERAAAATRAGTATAGPVFAGVRGGVGRLPLAVADAVRAAGGDVRTGATVRELRRTPFGWRLVVGPTTAPEVLDADAVVVAVPPPAAARLLRDVAPVAASTLAGVELASLALVTAVLPRAAADLLPAGSGVLVPPVEGRVVKAVTASSAKWPWLDDRDAEHVVVRASVGRHGDERDLQLDDDALTARVLADLTGVLDLREPLRPVATAVTRWGGGLPQYAVGHVDAMALVRREVARRPGLAVAGAAYDGVGVPAVIASAHRAARDVLSHLGDSTP
ncbi:protoporphyrinogen oxidase [Angustibacter aerolatus]